MCWKRELVGGGLWIVWCSMRWCRGGSEEGRGGQKRGCNAKPISASRSITRGNHRRSQEYLLSCCCLCLKDLQAHSPQKKGFLAVFCGEVSLSTFHLHRRSTRQPRPPMFGKHLFCGRVPLEQFLRSLPALEKVFGTLLGENLHLLPPTSLPLAFLYRKL